MVINNFLMNSSLKNENHNVGIDDQFIKLTNTGVIVHHEQDCDVDVVAVSNENLAWVEFTVASIQGFIRPHYQARICAVGVAVLFWQSAMPHSRGEGRVIVCGKFYSHRLNYHRQCLEKINKKGYKNFTQKLSGPAGSFHCYVT